jgi:hypothetical protein
MDTDLVHATGTLLTQQATQWAAILTGLFYLALQVAAATAALGAIAVTLYGEAWVARNIWRHWTAPRLSWRDMTAMAAGLGDEPPQPRNLTREAGQR